MVGEELKNLLTPLLPIIIPIAIILIAGIILILCCKYHPAIKRRREKEINLKKTRQDLSEKLQGLLDTRT